MTSTFVVVGHDRFEVHDEVLTEHVNHVAPLDQHDPSEVGKLAQGEIRAGSRRRR